MFLSLGMHRGPLLAYLMADPELSLQSILIVSAIIGRLKTWTYVGWVAVFSTLAGMIYGAWVDGASIGMIVLYLIVAIGVLAFGLYWIGKRVRHEVTPSQSEIQNKAILLILLVIIMATITGMLFGAFWG